jgi:hypothetical protein
MQHSGNAQSSKHADTFIDHTVSPWVFFFAKSSDCESSKRSVHPCNKPKKEQKIPWLPKSALLKLDSSRFPNNAHEAILMTNRDIF